MSEIRLSTSVQDVWARVTEEASARSRAAAEILPTNKSALFECLAAARITTAIVEFDGSRDSGQIEGIIARREDQVIDLPRGPVQITTILWDGSTVASSMSVGEALEALAYAFLEEEHGGWEDNEGAYGEFTFDVADRSISLNYNERVVESVHFHHAW